MKSIVVSYIIALLACIPFSQAFSQSSVVEERVINESGIIHTCGRGGGLSACRDFNGETYDQEINGPSMDSESMDEIMAEAARIRNESPEELSRTIRDLELGINPDESATEGLLD
ncbi:hypothetical protein A9Q88_01410 [Gammaproteobacteria bacterium 50_400_T64]|nr:hypothetical protein A9Q88_01410 [Gammaproteobacteria bacterium 50_400_T64]